MRIAHIAQHIDEDKRVDDTVSHQIHWRSCSRIDTFSLCPEWLFSRIIFVENALELVSEKSNVWSTRKLFA